MSDMDAVADLLGGGRTISYKTDLAHLTGSVTAGLLLSQFWYWTNLLPSDREGWFYKTAEDMQAETGMGRTEAEGARKKLRDLGLVTEERRGVPAKLWYRINKPKLYELLRHYAANKIAENLQTGVQETRKQESAEPANKPAESQQTITQNTTQTTQRIQQQSASPQAETKPEAQDVVALAAALTQDLIAQGVKQKVAQSLVKAYPHAVIRQQLAWLPQRKYADAAATLVESIKEGYDAPVAANKAVPRPKTRAVTRDTAERPPVLTEEQQAASREAMRTTLGRLRGRANATGAASMGDTL